MKSWQKDSQTGRNPHAMLFNKDKPRPIRRVEDPLSPEKRRKIEDIKWRLNNPQDLDFTEVWEE